jgi:hypothetical protein
MANGEDPFITAMFGLFCLFCVCGMFAAGDMADPW